MVTPMPMKPKRKTTWSTAPERIQNTAQPAPETEPLNREQMRIAKWLQNVHFRRQLFGGVSEQDVWKKIEKLDEMYREALIAERARYDALLEEKTAVQPQQQRPSGGDTDQ